MKRTMKATAELDRIMKQALSLKEDNRRAEVEEQKKRTERAMAGKTLSFKL